MSEFTAAERAMLDRATVPAMRDGLARDIVAAVGAGEPRRRVRGGWQRHGRLLLGAGALVIASATAAATGLLDRLPIRIPGITRAAEPPAPKPRPVVRAEKPRPMPGRTISVADIIPAPVPLIDPMPTPQDLARDRRAARIAAGLPVRPTLVQRAIAAKIRSLPPAERQAARAEWRRIRALPPAERRLAMAKIKAEFLARHPKMAQRYEARLEALAAAAAEGAGPPSAPPAVGARQPLAGALTPDQRAERRQQRREWRLQRRAQRLQNDGARWREGTVPPVR